MKQVKLGICIPSTGQCRIEFAESLARLRVDLALDSFCKVSNTKVFYLCSSVIPHNRQFAVSQALAWGATHILFVDDDMAFLSEAIKMLLMSRELPIVAANCVKRIYPTTFMSLDFMGNEVKTTMESKGLEEVMFTGNAVILIKREVFERMEKPWFAFPYDPKEDNFETEDYFFQRKARTLGYPIYIDHEASKLIIHIGAHNFDFKGSFKEGGKNV